MVTIYLGLGSNLGDRAQNIHEALQRLKKTIRLVQISSLYETEPVGPAAQPWFLNLVCRGETDLAPEALLHLVKRIEREMGRKKGLRFGPRLIDIDILFYDDLVISTPQLEIPHPRLHERGFTLVPLCEMAPELVHPLLGMTIRELQDSARTLEEVHPYAVRDEQASD